MRTVTCREIVTLFKVHGEGALSELRRDLYADIDDALKSIIEGGGSANDENAVLKVGVSKDAPDFQKMVLDFHNAFDHTIGSVPQMPSAEDAKLLMELHKEETGEFADAVASGHLLDAADALADILYVVFSSAVTMGIDIGPVFQEVHRSNMAKLWLDGKVHKNDLGKSLKPPGWAPPDINAVIMAQRGYPELLGPTVVRQPKTFNVGEAVEIMVGGVGPVWYGENSRVLLSSQQDPVYVRCEPETTLSGEVIGIVVSVEGSENSFKKMTVDEFKARMPVDRVFTTDNPVKRTPEQKNRDFDRAYRDPESVSGPPEPDAPHIVQEIIRDMVRAVVREELKIRDATVTQVPKDVYEFTVRNTFANGTSSLIIEVQGVGVGFIGTYIPTGYGRTSQEFLRWCWKACQVGWDECGQNWDRAGDGFYSGTAKDFQTARKDMMDAFARRWDEICKATDGHPVSPGGA